MRGRAGVDGSATARLFSSKRASWEREQERDITAITLTLLGGLTARRNGSPLVFPTRKSQALLAFLAFPPRRPHSRGRLTALLWGDLPERQGRHSLRQALLEVRRALSSGDENLLAADGEQIGLVEGRVDVDVDAFERLAREGDAPALEQAVELYRGDLLQGLVVREEAFEEWLLNERERLRELALGALGRLLVLHERAGRDDVAVRTAQRSLALDALQEPVHRALMRLHARQDRRAAALRQYQVCLTVLRRELGVEPEPKTTELYRELLAQAPGRSASARRPLARRPPITRAGRVADTPLVGRGGEMASLVAALDRAWTTRGPVVLVRGEAGIGKSRLIEELAADAVRRGGRVLLGHCHETEQILPFRPWIDALREGDALADPEALTALPHLTRLRLTRLFPELDATGAQVTTWSDDRGQIFEAMADLLAALAGQQPLVVALDDLQWADEMSLRLLSFVGRRLQAQPLLLVGAVRDEDAPDAGVLALALGELAGAGRLEEIQLAPLAADATTHLVRVVCRMRAAQLEAVGRRVWEISAGNPFVIVETMRTIHETTAEPESLPLPRTVRDFVAARLARLSAPAQHLLAVAAVIGRESSFGLLQGAAGLTEGETAAAVEELIRRRVLSAVGEGFQIDHERIREVALERLLPAVRRSREAAVGEALEALYPDRLAELSDRLAAHWVRADVPHHAVRVLMLFADTARRRYVLDDALRALDQALLIVERLPAAERDRRRTEVLIRKAWVLSVVGRFREILDLLSAHAGAVDRLGDPALAAQWHFRLGLTYCYLGDLTRAAGAEARAIREAERCGDQVTLGQAHYALALRACWLGEIRAGIEHGQQAVARLGAAGARDWQAQAWWALGLNHLLAGDFDRALEAEAEVEALARALGDTRLTAFAAYATARILATRGEGELAVASGRRALEAARDPIATAASTLFLGVAHVAQGDPAQALPLLEQAAAQLGRVGIKHTLAVALHHSAEAHLMIGEVATARELAGRALTLHRELGSPWGVAYDQQLLARVALAEGDTGAAHALATEALATHEAVGAAFEAGREHLLLAEIAGARGDLAGLAAHGRAAHQAFVVLGAPRWVARTVDLAGRLGLELLSAPAMDTSGS